MAPDGNQNRNQRGLAGGPIALAIAAAILICAVPLAYRILQCELFDSGFSLDRFFSFRCERAVKSPDGETPARPPTDGAAADQRVSPPEDSEEPTALTGYVYYEEKGRRPTEKDGVYLLLGRSGSPTYQSISKGAILKTISTSDVRAGPSTTENIIDSVVGGRCVEVLDSPAHPVTGLKEADSGGWLRVKATSCPT